MDIYSFLNSRDIAEHCRKIQKEWSPLEMALIISHSKRSVLDKHGAWRELISDYPDMMVPPMPECGVNGFESLHTIILTRIDYEERILRSFMEQTPGAVYRHQIAWNREWRYSNSIYTSFEKAWADVIDSWDRDEVSEILIEKILPDDGGRITVYFDYDQNVFRLDMWAPYEIAGPNDSEVTYFFENMCCADIPVPFQLGDVLTIPKKLRRENDQIFVLKPPDERVKKRYAKMKELPYYEDLDVNTDWGYTVSDAGILYGDHIGGADCFEYYRGKYGGPVRLLHYVGLYLKGELDLPEILTMQCRIFLKSQLERELDYQNHGCFIADDLLAENQLTETEKGTLVKNSGVMPWVEGKISFAQVEWLAQEFRTSTESVQKMLVYGVGQYGGSCAGIVHDEDHYEKTGDARFNPARRAMARMFLEAYGYTEEGWANKHERSEEVD